MSSTGQMLDICCDYKQKPLDGMFNQAIGLPKTDPPKKPCQTDRWLSYQGYCDLKFGKHIFSQIKLDLIMSTSIGHCTSGF